MARYLDTGSTQSTKRLRFDVDAIKENRIYRFEVQNDRVQTGTEIDPRLPGLTNPTLEQYLYLMRGVIETFELPFRYGMQTRGDTTTYFIEGTTLGWAARSIEVLLQARR